MFRPPAGFRALAAVVLVAGAAAACADKAAPPANRAATDTTGRRDTVTAAGQSNGESLPPSSSDTTSLAAWRKLPPQGQREADLAGILPTRDRKDSVALASMTKGDSTLDKLWPVKMPAPRPGAVFPGNRVVAFYGNPLSKKMGVLGEYPKDVMLAMLDKEAARWAKADPTHPVVPALHLIVTVAQGDPGKSGMYRMWMRDSLVNEVYSWAKAKHALFFIDVQVGLSTLQAELPRLRPFLENPDVHLAVDPEFSMKPSGEKPGKRIGTLDASDINWAVNFLDEIAKAKNLPPKILVIHRFTRKMVTNADKIRFTPNVQIVMDMDGWGPPWLKFDSYHDYVKKEPVQFTGFKLFYHNDTKKGDPLLTPAEVLRLNPRPLYIQYQ